jgi:hydroxymethylpyrimidine/phosphomethylpyrimidine kinase
VTRPVALTIAGSDPSGGAGIQADLKTFHQHGVYGTSVLTLLTVQNTVGVEQVEILSPDFAVAQLRAVVEDIPPAAAKTGALGSAAMVEAIAFEASSFAFPLVLDPVMISKHGAPLMQPDASKALIRLLLPAAALITPNLHEASAITGIEKIRRENMRDAAQAILDLGAAAVLLKGGHLAETEGPEAASIDLLATSADFFEFPSPRVQTRHTHGTGCTYSAAITAQLARGLSLFDAVQASKQWIYQAILTNPGLGRGSGPVNHFAPTN